MPTIKIDAEKCIGCGLCVSMCEGAFELKDDGKAHVKTPSDCSSCDCKSVAENCPVDAIKYEK